MLFGASGAPSMAGAPQVSGKSAAAIASVKKKADKKIKQADRKAAAQRAEAQGFALAEMGAAAMAMPGSAPHYFSHPNYANSPFRVIDPATGLPKVDSVTGQPMIGIEKFVDPLSWAPGAPLQSSLPLATPTVLPDGTHYYEIGLVQYRHQFHRDLAGTANGTLQRGYVQLTTDGTGVDLANENPDGSTSPIAGYKAVAAPSYLGPVIVATKNTPVRITFRNLLPNGDAGNLFLPVDVSVMGAGMGPAMGGMDEPNPQQPMCGEMPKPAGCFTENRATLHLHGGASPWISDGTPHQWITPAGERPYPDGAATPSANIGMSVEYVPDMWFDAAGKLIASCTGQTTCTTPGATNIPGSGAQTFYYTNQQSARLMFYHDHAWGITRLNVYAGEAAGYVITDATEGSLVSKGLIPGPADPDTIPLVIQDRTFVPSPDQLAVSDETWDVARWGGHGSLWFPHVYSPAQNPGDSSGVNQFGRWAYGPWFWPPTAGVKYGPVPNPHYDAACIPSVDPANPQWCEPQYMPGTPYNSMGMEAFNDTPVVNGKAYPTVTLDPKTYRLRILNAANDRFFNLSLYVADTSGKEVALNATEVAAALIDPAVFPTPDLTLSPPGPSWIQFGTEGGFLPAPVVIPPQPITWVTDPTVFNAGNVDQHSLLLGPAERADVLVDLSAYAGKTLILYNDAPAAFPARDPRYDYYTGNGDYRDTGGAPSTLPGYGPNTRTVMQIVVANTAPAPAYDLASLNAAFAHQLDPLTLKPAGVFESGQHPIVVGQGAYNSAYGTTFNSVGPSDGLARITDFSLTFKTLANGASGSSMTIPFQTKAIQDEQGEAFDPEYGRMSGNLGLEVPMVPGTAQNLILYPYVNPTSELIDGTNLPRGGVEVQPITSAADGTQIWKITHNGVDTHPIHFHLYDVQLLNRVGWDGIIRKPDANELGWKDTLRISPLEDTIVALRPIIPNVPFDLPNSIRPLNPMLPIGSTLGFANLDKNGLPTPQIINQWTNFGWEYVWHCHILSHEEMDMMRSVSVAIPPRAPTGLVGTRSGSGNKLANDLQWTDNSLNETAFIVRRATSPAGPWTNVATLMPDSTTYSNTIGNTSQTYFYQVVAENRVGYSATAGFSTLPVSSSSNLVQMPAVTAPSAITATAQLGPQIALTWTDTASNESGFALERSVGGSPFSPLATVGPRSGTGSVSYTDQTVAAGNTYQYRVAATGALGQTTSYVTSASVVLPAAPPAPTTVNATASLSGSNARVALTWTNVAGETGYRVQRATNAAFTANVVTSAVAADVLTFNTGNIARNTDFYFRVQSVNGVSPSAWVNATPFPIHTP
jgi:FtsP/CotA-like multicopper oxidase with cupredoxin domain